MWRIVPRLGVVNASLAMINGWFQGLVGPGPEVVVMQRGGLLRRFVVGAALVTTVIIIESDPFGFKDVDEEPAVSFAGRLMT